MASSLPVWRTGALALVALISAIGAWTLAGFVIAGTSFEDIGPILQSCSVFVVLTLLEKLYERFAGPAGH